MRKKDPAVCLCKVRQLLGTPDPLLHTSVVNAVDHFFRKGLIRIRGLHPLKTVCNKITGTDMHVLAVIKYILYRLLQKRHHMHPQNMKTFPLWCLLHILKKHFCVFQGFL